MTGIGALHEIDATVRGEPDPTTGYLIDIKAIDRAVREAAVPIIQRVFGTSPDPCESIGAMCSHLGSAMPVALARVRWRLTPYYSLEMSTDAPATVSIRRRYEFAASHRLHVPELSDERNRELFGKCNNPSGHGHNYIIEPCVDMAAASPDRALPSTIDRLVKTLVLDRFDHKHLNLDTQEFGEGGLNPSVENIARVCFDLLASPVADAGATLAGVTVWETDRTGATYPAHRSR
jgi:6-pyruvoyltetrahydropterin/6-carboxytetrahydropterin synthase